MLLNLNSWTRKLRFRNFSSKLSEIFSKVAENDLKHTPSQLITLTGWVKYVRKFNTHIFLRLNDGHSPHQLQIVINDSNIPEEGLYGSAVRVTGRLCPSPGGKQTFELQAETFERIANNDTKNYPLYASQNLPYEYLRNYPHLRAKTNLFSSILRGRSELTWLVHNYFKNNDFVFVNCPVLTKSDCEGGTNVFSVQGTVVPQGEGSNQPAKRFFEDSVYLTVSTQFHLESMMTSISNVYCLGPVFRADYSDNSRYHLAEFYMLEAEIAFLDTLEQLLTVWFVEDLISSLSSQLSLLLVKELEIISRHPGSKESRMSQYTKVPYPRVTYDEAIAILHSCKSKFKREVKNGEDLSKEHEMFLCQYFGGSPVFVTHFPMHLKPFYVKKSPDGRALTFDLVGPDVGEIVGGSLREMDQDELEDRMQGFAEKTRRNLNWYLEMRRYGCPPHGGFGLGFERLLQSFLGIPNIRDAIPFPRYSNSCLA